MKRALYVPVLLGLLLGACDNLLFSDPDDVFLRIDRAHYAPGDTVTLRLVNESGETISHNLCQHLVQARIEDGWLDTDYSHDGPCLAMLDRLAHDATAAHRGTLDGDTPAGVYRFRTFFELDDQGFTVVSRPFTVE